MVQVLTKHCIDMPTVKDTCCSFCHHTQGKYYDGAVGYEAIICTKCGAYSDHNGEHEIDEFSFMQIGCPTIPMRFHKPYEEYKEGDRLRYAFTNLKGELVTGSGRIASKYINAMDYPVIEMDNGVKLPFPVKQNSHA